MICHCRRFVACQHKSSTQQQSKRDLKAPNDCHVDCQWQHASASFSRRKRCFTSTHRSALRSQNDRVWSAGRKRDVSPSRLLIERAKFTSRVMVSAGVCLQGKGRLHFVQEKSKVNADYYMNELLQNLMDDCHYLLGQHFIFQQDGAPAHAAKSTQQWLAAQCPDSSRRMHGLQTAQI